MPESFEGYLSFMNFIGKEYKEASDALLRGDEFLTVEMIADDVVFFDPQGNVFKGVADVGDAFKRTAKRFAGSTKNEFEIIKTVVKGNFASLVGIQRSDVYVRGSGKVSYNLRLVLHFALENGKWKLTLRAASPLAEPTPPTAN